MFMRLVQVKVKLETADQIPHVYATTILPVLQQTPGCLYASLIRKVQHTFSELYQWKMAVERRSSAQVMTTEDMKVAGYDVVSGKLFQ